LVLAQEQPIENATTTDSRQAVVTLADGGQLNVRLADDRIRIQTPYGILTVPTEDIRQMTFAPRLNASEQKAISGWMEQLGSDDLTVRQQAADQLLALRSHAWYPLQNAARSGTGAIASEADALLDRIWEASPDADFASESFDILETPDCKIVGRILDEYLRIETQPFGELVLQLSDAVSVRSSALPDPEPEEQMASKDAQPDPGNLKAFENQIGRSFLFQVRGGGGGTIWGSNPYTTDSPLAAVVVHSGLAKTGETVVVQVTILGMLPSFAGSGRNGLASSNYGSYNGFEVRKPKKSRPRR
jgi:hypothetical protein